MCISYDPIFFIETRKVLALYLARVVCEECSVELMCDISSNEQPKLQVRAAGGLVLELPSRLSNGPTSVTLVSAA